MWLPVNRGQHKLKGFFFNEADKTVRGFGPARRNERWRGAGTPERFFQAVCERLGVHRVEIGNELSANLVENPDIACDYRH